MILSVSQTTESGDPGGPQTGHPFDGITVRAARSSFEVDQVHEVRYQGYAKYIEERGRIKEALDESPGCTLLLATNRQGQALGTMRLLDRRFGPIELDHYVDLDRILADGGDQVVEATRYSVPVGPQAKWVKLALCRAYFQYSHRHNLQTLLIWIRRSAEREYRRMLFEPIPEGTFSHPVLGGQLHTTWKLDVPTAPERYNLFAQPLYKLLYAGSHPHIRYD